MNTRALCIVAGVHASLASLAAGALPVDGVLAVANDGQKTYLAVQIDLPSGQALSRIDWINNDESAQPSVDVVAAGSDGTPSLSGTSASIEEPTWGSLEWVQGELLQPVTSQSGSVFVVFEFPAGNDMRGNGFGKGAGIAYRRGPALLRALISQDGETWTPIWDQLDVQCAVGLAPDAGAQILSAGAAKTALPEQADHSDSSHAGRATGLADPAPNPFNPSTVLGFELAQPGPVELSIYNLRGQRVRQLREGIYPAGNYRVRWDGSDERGQRLASAVYIVRLVAGGKADSKRLVLVK